MHFNDISVQLKSTELSYWRFSIKYHLSFVYMVYSDMHGVLLAMFEFFFVEFDDKWMKSVTAHRNSEKHVLIATFICSN